MVSSGPLAPIYLKHKKSVFLDLSVAFLSVSFITLLRFFFEPLVKFTEVPYLLSFLPVVFSSWYGGFRPGLIAAFLSGFTTLYVFINQGDNLIPSSLTQTYYLIIFSIEGTIISFLIGHLHIAYEKLQNFVMRLKAGENKIREHLSLIHTVIECLQDGVYVKDLQGKYILVNSAAKKFIGKKNEEIIGKTAEDLFPEETAKQIKESEEKALNTESAVSYDEKIIKDGSEYTLLSTKNIYKDAEGNIIGFVGISHDITERKIYEEKLVELNKSITNILESITDAFFALDQDGRFVYLNKQAEKLLGVPGGKVIGKSVWDEFPEIIDSEFYAKYFRAIATQQPLIFEKYYSPLKKNFEIHAYPSKEGISVYFNDVTERKRTEEVLRVNEERFRLLAESVPQIIWTANGEGRIEFYNKRWYEYTKITHQRTNGFGILQAIHPEQVDMAYSEWEKSLKNGTTFEIQCQLKRGSDKQYRWHLLRASPIRNNNKIILRWFGSATDIDDQKKLDERKDEFISTASHELKTPITTIKAFTQLLQKRFASDKFPDVSLYLYKMEYQVNRLKTLINDLLDVSKIRAGKLEYLDKEFDFNDLLKETIEDVQPTTSHKLIIKGKVRESFYGDRYRIGQVINNLISNAIKYSPKADKVILSLNSNKKEIEITVRDFGIGIAPEEINRIFDRFYRISGYNGERFEGMGLGLNIAAEIVKRHKGKIWAEKPEGKGSVFYVRLPYRTKHKRKENNELKKLPVKQKFHEEARFSSGR